MTTADTKGVSKGRFVSLLCRLFVVVWNLELADWRLGVDSKFFDFFGF
jgi:hypothetical protein